MLNASLSATRGMVKVLAVIWQDAWGCGIAAGVGDGQPLAPHRSAAADGMSRVRRIMAGA